MEKVRPRCGQPSDRGRLRTEQNRKYKVTNNNYLVQHVYTVIRKTWQRILNNTYCVLPLVTCDLEMLHQVPLDFRLLLFGTLPFNIRDCDTLLNINLRRCSSKKLLPPQQLYLRSNPYELHYMLHVARYKLYFTNLLNINRQILTHVTIFAV